MTKFAWFPPIEAPRPRGASDCKEWRRSLRDATSLLTFSDIREREAEERAVSASDEVGVEILYGALVFVRT